MTAPEDQNGLREALAPTYKKCPECAGSGTWECFGEDHCCEECSGSGSVEDLEPVILAERDAYRNRARAAEAEITRLKEGMEALGAALKPFAKLSFSFDGFSFDPAEMVVLGRCCGTFQPNEHAHLERAIDAARSALATLSPKEQPHG